MQDHSTQPELFEEEPGKRCSKCRKVYPTSEYSLFHHKIYGRRYRVSWCRKCQAKSRKARYATEAGKAAIQSSQLRQKYGITLAEYDTMLTVQNGLCAICGKPETATRKGAILKLSIDHSHSSGAIRSLLCNCCNSGIAFFKENPDLLQAAIDYLKKHST